MNGSINIPPIEYLKHKARIFRLEKVKEKLTISQAQALETLAHEYGFRDWNGLSAAAKKQINIVEIGQRVNGCYLGQDFNATVKNVRLDDDSRTRVTFVFDDAVDVVSFESFSSFRKQVSCFINQKAMTDEKTSNGLPQLALNL